jgi:Flp pilus assembly protein TadB
VEALAGVFAALAVLLLATAVYRLRRHRTATLRARRQVVRSWRKERTPFEVIGQYVGLDHADRLCQYAGRPYGLTGTTLLQYQFLFGLLVMVLFFAISVTFGLIIGGFAWYMPRFLLSAMATQRRTQIAMELPAFLDLWGLLVASGEGVETALVEICKRHPDWMLTAEILRVRDRVSASGLFGESLVEEAKVTGSPEFVAVAEQVSHLVEGGGLPSKELARMAEQMREQRVTELMQSAGAMAIVGIFPKLGAVFLSLMPVLATIVLTVQKQI